MLGQLDARLQHFVIAQIVTKAPAQAKENEARNGARLLLIRRSKTACGPDEPRHRALGCYAKRRTAMICNKRRGVRSRVEQDVGLRRTIVSLTFEIGCCCERMAAS